MRVAAVDLDELESSGLPLEEDTLGVEVDAGDAFEDGAVDEEKDEGENTEMLSEEDAADKEEEEEDDWDADVKTTLEVDEDEDVEM